MASMRKHRFIQKRAPERAPLVMALGLACSILLALLPESAHAQLPGTPAPIPGSLLDRGGRAVGAADLTRPSPSKGAADAPSPRPSHGIAFGTAFRVDDAGHLVTNRHVVDGCQAIGIVAAGGIANEVRLLATDSQQDLALLAGPPALSSATLRADNEPLQGEDALSYGFPLPGVLSAGGQLGAGMVTAVSGVRNDAGQLQTDVPLQSGNSGGALLDRRGHVIGVVFAKLNALRIAQITGDLPQNVNFAVQLGPLKRLLDAHGVRYTAGAGVAPVLSNQQIAAEARKWTVPIACQRSGPAAR